MEKSVYQLKVEAIAAYYLQEAGYCERNPEEVEAEIWKRSEACDSHEIEDGIKQGKEDIKKYITIK